VNTGTFYSERVVSKLMTKNTSLLAQNTAFEHKFHFDMRKWQKRPIYMYHTFSKNDFCPKQLDLEENIEETA
jgi:hypothetical protein